jgi:hypothetical protein
MPTINRVPVTKTSMSLTLAIMQGMQTVVNVKAALSVLSKKGNERVVTNVFLDIHEPHNNINNPGKWVTLNMCSESPRYTSI